MNAGERPPYRVAYVLPHLVAGGAERHVLSLVHGIDRERYAPIVIALAGGGELEAAFRDEGIPVYVLGRKRLSRVPGRGWNPLADAWSALWSMSGILRRERVRILHAYLPAANVIGPVAARLSSVPRTIVSKRSLADYKEGHPLLRKFESLGNRIADAILVNSDAVRRDVERTERDWEGKFRRIYNGVASIDPWLPEEVAAFRAREGLPIGGAVAVCVSNFFDYKGHAELVEADARIAETLPDLTWVLVGRDAGSLEETLQRIRERGASRRFRFVGARSDVPDLLRAADLFVHPSRQEGFSNAILEAMAAGLPVVACDVGGNPEAIADGETGRLIPSRNPERLASAIREILLDKGKRTAMGKAGRRRAAERFSLACMIGEIEGMYESLARRGDRER